MKRLLLRFMLVFLAVLTISYAAAPFDSSDGGHEKTERSRRVWHAISACQILILRINSENRTKKLIQLKVLSGGIMMLIKMII